MYHFIPINTPLFRWAVSSPCYLSAFSEPIYSWAHFQHSFTYGLLLSFSACGRNSARGSSWPVNMLGHFHSVIKYGLLTMAHYGRPMNAVCLAHVWPIDHTARIRPIDDTTPRRPIDDTTCRRPIVSTTRRRPIVTTVNM